MSTPDLPERVRRFVDENELLLEGTPTVVGVSGGLDSMVLLHLLVEGGFEPVAVHVNYRLRGDASDADERHVRTWCERRGVPVFVHRIDLRQELEASGESLQARARDIRYAEFERIARAHGVSVVAVAHHVDDQIETVLLNLFRGSGPEGIAGMPVKRRLAEAIDLVRPLLDVRRHEIEEYARSCGLEWRDDASNAEVKYRRGFIRNELLPKVADAIGTDVSEGIARSAGLMRQYNETSFKPELRRRLDRCKAEEAAALRIGDVKQQPAIWRGRVLLEGLRLWLPEAPQTMASADRLEELLHSQPGRRVEFEGGTVWRDREVLRFCAEPDRKEDEAVASIDGVPASVEVPRGAVSIRRTGPSEAVDFAADRTSEQLAVDAVRFPITIRRWKDGDRFHPLGAPGSRKVSDFLTDQKVPPSRRKDVLVAEDEVGIIWIIGHRLDERVKVRPETKSIAKMSFVPAI